MEKNSALIVVSALFLLGVAGFVQCSKEAFELSGRVICDTCRIGWPTIISPVVPDAEVSLECYTVQQAESKKEERPSFTTKGKTNHKGEYTFVVPPQHQGEICVVHAVSSPDPNCNEQCTQSKRFAITLDETKTGNHKIHVNPAVLSAKHAVDECIPLLHKMGFAVDIDEAGDLELKE